MKFKSVNSPLEDVSVVVLFAETKKDDYIFNHALSIVSDVEDATDLQVAKKYRDMPETALVTSRTCAIATVNIKGDLSYEQSGIAGTSIPEHGERDYFIIKG